MNTRRWAWGACCRRRMVAILRQKKQNTSHPRQRKRWAIPPLSASALLNPGPPASYPSLQDTIDSLSVLTFDSTTVRSIVPEFVLMSHWSFRSLTLFLTGLWALLLLGCEADNAPQSQYLGGIYGNNPVSTYAPQDSVSYWDGDGVSGKASIKIKLGEQRAYFYKSGQLVGISQLSTGREGLSTPSGSFSIIQKDVAHVSSKYGDYVDAEDNVVASNVDVDKDRKPPGTHFKGAPMPYFMRIVGGVGMHAGYLPA